MSFLWVFRIMALSFAKPMLHNGEAYIRLERTFSLYNCIYSLKFLRTHLRLKNFWFSEPIPSVDVHQDTRT